MKKQTIFNLSSIPKLILTVVLIVCIGAVMGLMGWALTKKQTRVEAPEVKTPDEIVKKTDSQNILSDEEVYEILKEFAVKPNVANISDDDILLDAIKFQNGDIKERLEKVEHDLKERGKVLADAIDGRGYINATTKVCIARSIIYNDLKHIKHTCNLKDDSFISTKDVDDITATEEIILYFLTGFAYFKDEDYARASYYLNQVILHRQAEIDRWGESYFFDVSGEVYGKIYKKTMEVLNEIEPADFKNPVASYLKGAELQCENDNQMKNIANALNDILTLSEEQLKVKKYKDSTGKENQWDLHTLIYRHFVPEYPGVALGDNFFHDVKLEEAQKQVKQVLEKYFSEKTETSRIKVLSPNGGEELAKGETYSIEWDCPDDAETNVVDIFIADKRMSDKGIVRPIGGILECSAEKYSWRVGDISPGENCFKIQLRHIAGSADIIDESDNYFSIVE